MNFKRRLEISQVVDALGYGLRATEQEMDSRVHGRGN